MFILVQSAKAERCTP